MITLVSRSETARGPLLARFTHAYGKLRFRSTCPFTQRRSCASPSGFATGSTHRSMPLTGRPSISPYATYWPKSSSPCMVAITTTTGLPGSPARYAVIFRPLCERPMTSEWYQVRGFVIAATALVRARSVALVIRPWLES